MILWKSLLTPVQPYRIAALLAGLLTSLSAVGFELAVSNERSDEVLIHDERGKVLRTLFRCERPRDLHYNGETNSLWIACAEQNQVVRVSVEDGEILQTITGLDGASTLAMNEENLLVVSNERASTASVIELPEGKLLATLPTGYEPDGVAISVDHKRIFVASENAGLVHVFSTQDYSEEAKILTNLRPRGLAIAESELWVSTEMGSRVEIFDIQTLKKVDEIIFAPRGLRSEQLTPVDIIFSTDTRFAYVALGAANHIAIIDRQTREILKYILVGRRAWGLALSPNEDRLYVLNGLSDDMTIIDLDSRRPVASVRTGLVPRAVEVLQ